MPRQFVPSVPVTATQIKSINFTATDEDGNTVPVPEGSAAGDYLINMPDGSISHIKQAEFETEYKPA